MAKKKLLLSLVAALLLTGAIAASLPFIASLGPSDNAGTTLTRIDIADLEPGTFKSQDIPGLGTYYSRVYILNDYSSNIRVYGVRLRDNKVQLPDYQWWSWGQTCADFGPEHEGKVLRPNGVIKCHDSDMREWYRDWAWNYDGTSLSDQQLDMETPDWVLEGSKIVIGKR